MQPETQLDHNRREISQVMADILPRFLTKYAPDAPRVAEVLQILHLMDLNVYIDLRMSKVRSIFASTPDRSVADMEDVDIM
jgi:hypothetical protein